MLWHLKQETVDDKKLAWLIELYEKGEISKDPRPKQEDIPALDSDLEWIWEVYSFLSERRPVTSRGPRYITVEAIDCYLRLLDRTERYYVEQALYFIPILDRIYLKHFYDKQEENYKKEQARLSRKNPLGR